jgi:SAM-dependent methyltransferase
MSYRDQFAGRPAAVAYDEQQYRPGSYADLLWQIERQQLRDVVSGLRAGHPRIDYLDFATGTGRVLGFLQPLVDSAVGIDVSEAMAERARSRVPAATVLCRDIAAAGAPVEGSYDLITAFRFLLNAEPALRTAALAALARRLRDPSSVLVVNNHGNLWSHKALLWPVHQAAGRVRPGSSGNYLSHRAVLGLVERAGLRVEQVLGCGVLGARLARRLPGARVADWERRLAATRAVGAAVNRMYVCRRAEPADRAERSA